MGRVLDELWASAECYDDAVDGFRLPRPEVFNFVTDIIDAYCERQPDQTAILWIGARKERRDLSYAWLARESHRAAHALHRLGVGRGDRVMIMLPRIPEWWAIVMGTLLIGGIVCPSTTLLQPHDLKYRVGVSGARVFVGTRGTAEKFEEARLKTDVMILVDDYLEDSSQKMRHWVSWTTVVSEEEHAGVRTLATDPALLFFSSGTTGMPKMIQHNHTSYPLALWTTGRYWLGLAPGKVYWNLSELGWAKASWACFSTFITGATLFIEDTRGAFSPINTLETLASYPITTLCAPPTAYRPLVAPSMRQKITSDFAQRWKLERCVGAGEPLNPGVITAWHDATGLDIADGYGQTETILVCANWIASRFPIRQGSMGRPAPGVRMAVLDVPHRRKTEPMEEGEFAICCDDGGVAVLFSGYLKPEGVVRPVVALEADGSTWYATGDRGYVDVDGYFWFKGRDDDVINSSGYRIGPFEVESALKDHPAVLESGVVASPDLQRFEIVKAFVMLADGHTPSDALVKEIQDHVKRVAAPYKYPREIEFVDALPKTVSGKIQRVILRNAEKHKKAHVIQQLNRNSRL